MRATWLFGLAGCVSTVNGYCMKCGWSCKFGNTETWAPLRWKHFLHTQRTIPGLKSNHQWFLLTNCLDLGTWCAVTFIPLSSMRLHMGKISTWKESRGGQIPALDKPLSLCSPSPARYVTDLTHTSRGIYFPVASFFSFAHAHSYVCYALQI